MGFNMITQKLSKPMELLTCYVLYKLCYVG